LRTLNPPEKVEVAVEEVALKRGAVTVPVKTPAPVTERGVPGEVVPMPRKPVGESKRNCEDTPALPKRMVEEAKSPPWSWRAVDVALTAVAPKVVGVKGKIAVREEDETLLLKVVQSAEAR
jgi:hypothetical protein